MGKRICRRWTSDELQLVIEGYKNHIPVIEIAKTIDRSPKCVSDKASRLGIVRPCIKWLAKEELRLKELHAQGLSLQELSYILDRSIPGIKMKLSKLGLTETYNEWTDEELSILKEEYAKCTTYKEIAQKIGRSEGAIKWKIQTLNLPNNKTEWTPEELEQLLGYKAQNLSYKEISEKMNRSEVSVNVKANRSGMGRPEGRYAVNQNYFHTIDSQKKAYWLGWMISDGNVSNRNRVNLHLCIKDIDVLEDLRQDLESDAPIGTLPPRTNVYKGQEIRGKGGCVFGVNSDIMAKDLANYNVVPNKTYICRFPRKLDSQYYPGFIAGLISGDGCVVVHSRDIALQTTILGTKDLIDNVRSVLIENIQFNQEKISHKYPRTKCLFGLTLNHHESVRLNNWFLENNISLMPRKQNIINQFFTDYPEKNKAVA